MATETLKEKAKTRRGAVEILSQIEKAAHGEKIPQLADFLEAMSNEVTMKECAVIMKEAIQGGSPAVKREFVRMYADIMKVHQKMTGDITQDEISKMEDAQIEALLRDNLSKWNRG